MTDEELERVVELAKRDRLDLVSYGALYHALRELRAYRQATKDQPILRARVERMALEDQRPGAEQGQSGES